MLNEYYFKERIDEMDSVRDSIRFYNDMIDECEKKLENPDDATYEELINEMNNYSEYIETRKERLAILEEEFNERCLFTTKVTLSFVTKVLNDMGLRKFNLINTGNEYIIASSDREERYTFPCTDKLNLYRLVMERGAFVDNHPEIKDVLIDILNRRAESLSYDETKEMAIFQMVYASLPANHSETLKDKPLMHPGFKNIINDLVRFIFDYADYSKATVDDFKKVYRKIIAGELNELMEKKYWFGPDVDARTLADIIGYTREYGIEVNLTRENYIVYARFIGLLEHVEYLDRYGEMYLSINGRTQTMATEDEREEIDKIASRVFRSNYNWREARELAKSISNLDYYEDADFPHNVDKIRDSLNVLPNTLFDKVDGDLDLKSDISKLSDEATRLVAKLHANGDIRTLFNEPCKSSEEAYLRRMILASWDLSQAFNDKKIDPEEQKKIFDELLKGTELSNDTLSILFDKEYHSTEHSRLEYEEELVDLACGTLLPFLKKDRIKNTYTMCEEIQLGFGIRYGVVGYNDVNTLDLPNHDKLYSIFHDDIKPKFKRLQEQYDYLFDNASDTEFLEGAVEIYGDILVMQAFRSGNKRTAKSLFNAMLLSRGIIPPVNDLNEQEKRLWLDIAYGRYERYLRAKYKLLLQTVDVKRKMSEKEFSEPLSFYDMENEELMYK